MLIGTFIACRFCQHCLQGDDLMQSENLSNSRAVSGVSCLHKRPFKNTTKEYRTDLLILAKCRVYFVIPFPLMTAQEKVSRIITSLCCLRRKIPTHHLSRPIVLYRYLVHLLCSMLNRAIFPMHLL